MAGKRKTKLFRICQTSHPQADPQYLHNQAVLTKRLPLWLVPA
jgi:hypothetical protein